MKILASFVYISVVFFGLGAAFAKELPQQGPDACVYIRTADAELSGDTFSVEFQLAEPGAYSLQLVHAPEIAEPTASVKVDDAPVTGALARKYWIEDGIVSSFESPVVLETAGKKKITVQCSSKPNWVRLVPAIYESSRIKVGSYHYHQEWVRIHESPEKKAAQKWFKGAKFGMFIHWGVYSQAAGSWKGVKIEDSGHKGPRVAEWLMYTFKITRDEYREYAKQFHPDQSFAQKVAVLAKRTGMKYVVITSKHHDGFALFDSKHSDWDIADATPYEGDLILELYEACRARGIDFGVYYSHGHDWMDGADANYVKEKARRDEYNVPIRINGKNLWDPSPDVYKEYLEKKAYAQVRELVEMMPELRLIWFDGDGLVTERQALRFYKMVHELNPNIIVNRRVGYEYGDYMDAGDNRTPKAGELIPKYFETCGTANHSWGYKAHDHKWKSTAQLLRKFVDIISKGANYLLNIGPDGKGTVPEPCERNFLELGKWVQAHGEAIYGTSRWIQFSENVNPEKNAANAAGEFWFSAKDNHVYAMSLTPAPATVTIEAFQTSRGKVLAVRLLNGPELESWKQGTSGLEMDFSTIETGERGYVIEVTLDK